EQRFADQADRDASIRGLNHRPQAGATGANDQDIVRVGRVARHLSVRTSQYTTGPPAASNHHKSLTSVRMPIEHKRTYRSESATEKRLIQANSMCRPLRALEQL